MSSDINQKASTPDAISPSLPTFTLKKKTKKATSKRKKSKPINKASFCMSMPSPPININDENKNNNTRNIVSPHYKLSLQSTTKSRSKSPRSSSTKARKNSRSGTKHIHRASDILKSSPRARSARKSSSKSKHSKTKSVSNTMNVSKSNGNKTPRKKRKGSRSSRNSVQMFFPLNNEQKRDDLGNGNEDDSDEENLFDSLAPIPSNNSLPVLSISASNPCSTSKTPNNRYRSRKGSNASNKTSTPFDDDIKFGDMALLKRLKTENKELRKSRNLLRKDHDVLKKIESKLRHKLEIILAKFKQIAIDFGDDKPDKTDVNLMQKQGDIEGVLEAVFSKFGQITDQYVKRQKIWKEQNKKWKDLTKKWYQFEAEYIVNEREISNRNAGNKNVGDILSNSVGKQFEVEYMFNCLKKKFDQVNTEQTQRSKEYSTMMSKTQKSNKKQKERLDSMEEELLMLRKRNEELNENEHRMNQLKQEHLAMTRKLNETEEKFKTTKETMTKQLKEKNDELDVYKKQHEIMNDNMEKLMDELKESKQCKDKLETDNKSLSEELKDIKSKYDELQTFEAKYKIMSTKLKDKDDELTELKSTNLILTTKANQLDELQKEYQLLTDKLSQCQSDRDQLKEENVTLTKKSKALDGLKIEYAATQKRLKDVKIEIDGLQEEFRTIYKAKKKLEIENEKLKGEISELKSKNEKLSVENSEFGEIVNREKRECGTQTEFAFIAEEHHLEALRKDNMYLMKELNFLIAERSRFKPAVGDNDFHRGDINSIACSPTNHQIITGGKHDNSVRIWEPKNNEKGSEITFIPKRKAFVDGTVLSVTISEDGILAAAGCSLKNTPNGYVVIWNLKDSGNVLCNLRSRTLLRFGKVHCVKFMKFDPSDDDKKKTNLPLTPRRHKRASSNIASARSNGHKTRSSSTHKKRDRHHKQRQSMNVPQSKDINKKLKSKKSVGIDGEIMNYLLFGGDTTGCVLCWNLSLDNCQTPVCVINGHTDIIYDLCIVDNKWLFSVSHDECLMYVNISGFKNKTNNSDMNGHGSMDYVFNKKLYKDDSKYPLKSVTYNHSKNELLFGSRKCNMFSMNTEYDDDSKMNDSSLLPIPNAEQKKYFKNKNFLNTKDLDHISNLRIKDNIMMVQRNGINYVKVFNLETNKLIKTYQIDDGDNDNNKFKIYDCAISFDKKYAILCVGIFTKENLSNLDLNRSALKGFKIPKGSKNKQQH